MENLKIFFKPEEAQAQAQAQGVGLLEFHVKGEVYYEIWFAPAERKCAHQEWW